MNAIEAYQIAMERTEAKLQLIYNEIKLLSERENFEGKITVETGAGQLHVILRTLEREGYTVINTCTLKDGRYEINLFWDKYPQKGELE